MGDSLIFALACATAALVDCLLAVWVEESFRLVRDSESRYHHLEEESRQRTEVLRRVTDFAPVTFSVATDSEWHQISGNRIAYEMLEVTRSLGATFQCWHRQTVLTRFQRSWNGTAWQAH